MADHDHDPADPLLTDEAWLRNHMYRSHSGSLGLPHLSYGALIRSHDYRHPELSALDRPPVAEADIARLREEQLRLCSEHEKLGSRIAEISLVLARAEDARLARIETARHG